MKIFNLLFFIVFLFFAGLQYNDPDPYLWIPIYLYGAFLCLLAVMNRYKRWHYVIGLLFYIAYAAYLLFDTNGVISWIGNHQAENIVQSMEPDKPWIEETREFFGLTILIMVLVINMVWKTKAQMARSADDIRRSYFNRQLRQ